MIKANTTIIIGGKTFQAGQTVNGLSSLDKKWMSEAGYITEADGKKKEIEKLEHEGIKADEQL